MLTNLSMSDPRDKYISRVVKGKSFADVGGLWGTVNEKVSVAYQYGAFALSMIDITPPGQDLWSKFEDRRRALGLPEVQCISADILSIGDSLPEVRFDVVHCSGVLYHVPDPVRLLLSLRKITCKYLVLTSSVTGTQVLSDEGTLSVPEGAALFIPALKGRERAIIKSYWLQFVTAFGLTSEVASWRSNDFGLWWWLPTVQALTSMCEAAGFRREDGAYFWNDNAYVLLLSVVE
jgi:SAM-dependent methyltransferase